MDLFAKHPLSTTEKTAARSVARTIVTGTPDTWSQQILDAFYLAAPFAGEHQVALTLDKQDPGTGSAYGTVLISRKTLQPGITAAPAGITGGPKYQPIMPAQGDMADGVTEDRPPQGSPAPPARAGGVIRVPVMMVGGKLAPLDVFIDASETFWPLTEQRVAEALLDSPGMQPSGDSSPTAGDLNPTPAIPSYRVKQASALLHGVTREDLEDLLVSGNLTESEKASLAAGGGVRRVLQAIEHSSDRGQDTAVTTKVAALVKVAGGFDVVTYNGEFKVDRVSNSSVSGRFAKTAIENGYAILGAKAQTPSHRFAPVQEAGLFNLPVRGKIASAFVFPDVVDLVTGEELRGTSLVVHDGGYSLTPDVVGEKTASADKSLAGGPPRLGRGFFVLPSNKVTDVVEVVSIVKEASADGSGEYTSTVTVRSGGRTHRTILSKHVRDLVVTKHASILPERSSFVEMVGHDQITADALAAFMADRINDSVSTIRVTATEDGVRLSGPGIESTGLKPYEASLVAAHHGADAYEIEKAACAAMRRPGYLYHVPFTPTPMQKVATRRSPASVDGIKVNLVKLAAALSDRSSIDMTLSLGLITPDNLYEFADAIPELEAALNLSCKLLVACRLGAPDVDENEVSSATKALDRSIMGLRVLRTRISSNAA